MSHNLSLMLFLALNILDSISTYIGLERGLWEGNPVSGPLLARYGLGPLFGLKSLVILGVLAFLLAFGKRWPLLWRGIWGLNVWLALTVAANLVQAVIA